MRRHSFIHAVLDLALAASFLALLTVICVATAQTIGWQMLLLIWAIGVPAGWIGAALAVGRVTTGRWL